MNAVWQSNRIDILGYVHKVLAHIVNISKNPIGPKDCDEKKNSSSSEALYFVL